MPKANITNTFVKRARCPKEKKKIDYFDTIDTGLVLEVRATGTKTFYYRYNENGTTHQKKLSDGKSMSANEARTIIQTLKKDKVYNTPITLQSKLQLEPNHTSITLEEFYDQFYLAYVQKHIKSCKANKNIFINHILPSLGNIAMITVRKVDVIKYHSDMVNVKKLAPAYANKFLIFLSQAYKLAYEFEILQTQYNPVKGIKHFEENNEQERFLTKEESKRLLEAVKQSPNRNLQYIIPMLLLSGARISEVLKSQWKDFDEKQMLWTIPITKNGKKRVLPLTKALHQILKEVPQSNTPYLFPSSVSNKPYTSIYRSWNTARTKARLEDVRIHDLRHSYASALVNAKCSLYEVQKLLGHSSIRMTQRYSHLSNETLMSAASKAGELFG
ncbi:MAG: tyrosine-type recombinase/integrase [Arcobacteraceae bacterium]